MSRKKNVLIAGVIMAAVLVGSAVLVKIYFAQAVQKLLSEMTDMGVVMEDIELHYSPLPYLLVSNLEVQTGNDSVRIPKLKIYPDVGSLLGGELRLKHVVLEDPSVEAAAHRESSDDSEFVLPEIFPQKLDVVSGRVQLTNGFEGAPLTVSASMEKEGGGFAFNVRSASIKELGFKFSGRMNIISSDPLKLDLHAGQCSVDPAAFIGFLTGFGYLGEEAIPELAEAGKFETTELDFNLDSAAGSMFLKSGGLALDSTSGKNLSLQLGQGGVFKLLLEEAKIDAGELFAMAGRSERGRNATRELCASAKLKSIQPQGTLILKSVELASSLVNGKSSGVSGRLGLAAKDLVLVLESLEGKKQQLSISDMDVDIELKDGKPVVSVRSYNVASSEGGSCNLSASIALPFDSRNLRFKAEAMNFNIFDYVLTCEAEKKNSLQTGFDTQLTHKSTRISASGYLNTPRYSGRPYEAHLKSLSIRDSSAEAESSRAENFDFAALIGKGVSGRASIRRFYYNDWPFSDVALYMKSGKFRAVLKASGKLFNLNLQSDVVFAENELAAQCSAKGRGTSLPSLIACFAKDLSVSVRGRVYMNANVFVQGKNSGDLADSIRGDSTVKIDNLHLFNLANLDPRLGFVIDIMDAVSMSPDSGEGLAFDSARLRAGLSGKKLFINSFNLNGRLLQAWGTGILSFADKRLQIDGRVRSMFGTVNSFSVDRKLNS